MQDGLRGPLWKHGSTPSRGHDPHVENFCITTLIPFNIEYLLQVKHKQVEIYIEDYLCNTICVSN